MNILSMDSLESDGMEESSGGSVGASSGHRDIPKGRRASSRPSTRDRTDVLLKTGQLRGIRSWLQQ